MKSNYMVPESFPLFNHRLIEASAGTGKTYTIANLYLRLVLEDGDSEASFFKALLPEQILVVTFTEAATAELRERIRARINDARQAFIHGESNDNFIKTLIERSENKKLSIKRLLIAERQMDEAAIYTIHSFCQRLIKQYAFEIGLFFKSELLVDEQDLLLKTTIEYWRNRFYGVSKRLTKTLRSYWKCPEDLVKDIKSWVNYNGLQILAGSAENLEQRYDEKCADIDDFKIKWLEKVNYVADSIRESGIDKRSYSKNNLPKWINEVSEWAKESTQDLSINEKLHKFCQNELCEKTKKGIPPKNELFVQCQLLFESDMDFRSPLLAEAIKDIKKRMQETKLLLRQVSFDDLLKTVADALVGDGSKYLIMKLREQYPIAMVDEFQDTDLLQYSIFTEIYAQMPELGLFMIGDPKQAVYGFRGADIFTYIKARSNAKEYYSLDTNWRSSAGMINSVNKLFGMKNIPFIFEKIPFQSVKVAEKNKNNMMTINGNSVCAMKCWLDPSKKDCVSNKDYEDVMLKATAYEVARLLTLSDQGQCTLHSSDGSQPLKAGDIAVLVRTRVQGVEVQKALSNSGVKSIFFGGSGSVFDTVIGKDLLRVLWACLYPMNERYLRAALATSIFQLSAVELDQLNNNEGSWVCIDEFAKYQEIWFKYGVLAMLRHLLIVRGMAQKWVVSSTGERQMTDYLHIGELLAIESESINNNPYVLVRWLSDQLVQCKPSSDEIKQHLESDRKLVQIITIHKSKGLERGVVFLPFICNYKKSEQATYHNDKFETVLDLNVTDPCGLKKAEKEQLAENIRLLYVGVTRAKYCCYLGFAPVGLNKLCKIDETAVGYLLQCELGTDRKTLIDKLHKLESSSNDIEVCELSLYDKVVYKSKDEEVLSFRVRTMKRTVSSSWRQVSYSSLSVPKTNKQESHKLLNASDANLDFTASNDLDIGITNEAIDVEPSPFGFPKGARPGTFLHELLENISFNNVDYQSLQRLIDEKLLLFGFDPNWQQMLCEWILQILRTPLVTPEFGEFCLQDIVEERCLVEMEFTIPCNNLQVSPLNNIIRSYDSLSKQANALDFYDVQGFLRGFIDLVCEYSGRYYLIDYKSNYLGSRETDYDKYSISKSMVDHRYDFQYQLYTLALHRFLGSRIPDYQYETHFGGVFYLFLRGMRGNSSQGVFYERPKYELVHGLDCLFAGVS